VTNGHHVAVQRRATAHAAAKARSLRVSASFDRDRALDDEAMLRTRLPVSSSIKGSRAVVAQPPRGTPGEKRARNRPLLPEGPSNGAAPRLAAHGPRSRDPSVSPIQIPRRRTEKLEAAVPLARGSARSPGVQRVVAKPRRSSMSHTSSTATTTNQSSRVLPVGSQSRRRPFITSIVSLTGAPDTSLPQTGAGGARTEKRTNPIHPANSPRGIFAWW